MSIPSSRCDESTHSTDRVARDGETVELRAQVEKMKERERRLMELLQATSPEKIEHDLRNVLNELVLLRALFDPKSSN